VDAAVFEPIPVKSAVRDGCTHVLALCSRPASSGPAWGRMVKRTLTATVKNLLLSPVSGRRAGGEGGLARQEGPAPAAFLLQGAALNPPDH
jgi:hypothetical protein